MGRLFDAAAALAGLGADNTYEAQLPMALEAAVDENEEGKYSVGMESSQAGAAPLESSTDNHGAYRRSSKKCGRTGNCRTVSQCHRCGPAGICTKSKRKNHGIEKTALSGGVFCNRYLSNRLIRLLREDGFTVCFKRQVPANDGGIALGQAAIAAAKIEKIVS